jgi:hypothetical protein
MSPLISHQGLRWRMDHTEPHALPWWWGGGQMVLLWGGWWVLLRVLADIMGGGKDEVTRLVDWAVVGAVSVGMLVTMGVTLSRWRWNWTEILANPQGLVLRRRFSQRTLRWSEIQRIEADTYGLHLESTSGRIELGRGDQPLHVLQDVARWLETGRVSGFEALPVPAPPPELTRLRQKDR